MCIYYNISFTDTKYKIETFSCVLADKWFTYIINAERIKCYNFQRTYVRVIIYILCLAPIGCYRYVRVPSNQ